MLHYRPAGSLGLTGVRPVNHRWHLMTRGDLPGTHSSAADDRRSMKFESIISTVARLSRNGARSQGRF